MGVDEIVPFKFGDRIRRKKRSKVVYVFLGRFKNNKYAICTVDKAEKILERRWVSTATLITHYELCPIWQVLYGKKA